MTRVLCLVSLFAVALAGCTTHIAPYRAKKRRYKMGSYERPSNVGTGSLYVGGGRGLFEDAVASRIGDILVIVIDEQESASRDSTTQLERKNTVANSIGNALGLMAKLQSKFPSVDPAKLLGADSSSQFAGTGKIQRGGKLNATLPVRVRKRMPNGDLYIEGTKVVMVGAEEHHLYVSGLVRREDISQNNTVLSSRIADAEIEYTGRGDVSDHQRPGWFGRLMGKIWPF